MAGSVFYLAPVDNASGKIFGLKQKWMAVRRLTGKRQRGCAVTGERTTPYSQDEMAHQEKFKAVAAATRLRMKDPGKVMQDQAAFKEQTKYKTFYRFVFNLEWEAYEAELRSLENGAKTPQKSADFPGTPYAPTERRFAATV